MATPDKVSFTHYRGDTLAFSVEVWDDADKTIPSDLSAALVSAQVRESPDDTQVLADLEVTVTGNTVNLVLPPKGARELKASNVFDVQVDWYADDTNVQTVLAGTISAGKDVTRE
jgi:hypothetical protein